MMKNRKAVAVAKVKADQTLYSSDENLVFHLHGLKMWSGLYVILYNRIK